MESRIVAGGSYFPELVVLAVSPAGGEMVWRIAATVSV
jgi:hypothetical protein